MTDLEQRVCALEAFAQNIIALPHLSNLAGRNSADLIARLQMLISADKLALLSDALSDDERLQTAERVAKNEHLVSPALSFVPYENTTPQSND